MTVLQPTAGSFYLTFYSLAKTGTSWMFSAVEESKLEKDC